VEQLADDLRAFLAGAPVSARRLTVGYFLTKWAARRRMPLAIGLTLALVGIASGVYAYGWWTAQKSRAEAEAQHARHSRYINQITSARKAIEEHDVKHAQQLLARTPPAERGWEWRWLSHVADSSVFTARLPDRGNGAVFFSRDGRQLRAVRPNGQMLAWDLATGSRIDRPPDTPVNASTARAATNAPVVLFTTPEGRIGVWDPRTDTRKSVMTDSDLRLSRPKISPTGRHVTWSTAQGALAVWNTQTGMVTTHASTGLRPIAISSHNAVIVVQGDSATYRYSWPNGQLDKTPLTRSSTIPSGSFSPDGRWLALLDEPADHLQIYRLDPNKASRQRTIETRTGIRKIVFSNDGELLAAASANRVIRVWSLRDDRLVSVLRGHASAPVALRFSDSGRSIASVGWNGTVKVWRLHQSSLPTRVWHSASSGITCMDVNEAHRLIAVGLADGSVGLVESASQQVRMLNGRHPGQVVSVNAGGKAPVISSVCSAETILLHRPATGSSTALSHRPDEQILHAKVSPRGGFVAIRSTSGIAVHHVSTGKTLLQIPRAAGCAWSPDGRRLLIARADPNQQSIRLGRVDLADRQVRWLGRVDGVDLHDMCIDDAGRSIAILSPDGRVRIWNVAQRRATTVIDTRHPRVGQIRCRFNADGTRILTSGHTAKLWDVETGIQLLELINRGSRRPITYAAFSNDDTTVTAAQGHRVVQWAPRGVRRTP
ncbi:MAG: hypothetical protein KGY81_10750, partial [Phycisphaerae bacterium]|nr:hypothetical protein [Phycisphaerae bacterium]